MMSVPWHGAAGPGRHHAVRPWGQPTLSSRCGRGHDVIAAINNRYNRVCADPNLSKLAGEHGGKMAGRHIIQIRNRALARVPRGKTVRQESSSKGRGREGLRGGGSAGALSARAR